MPSNPLGDSGSIPKMQRSLKQNLAAGAAVTALLVGGAVAAVTATGQSNGHTGKATHAGAHRGGDLTTAAGYLVVSTAQLEGELQSGKTLAQIANNTSGKSAEGLVEALVAAKKRQLADAQANLVRRVTAEVNRAGGPRFGLHRAGDRPGAGAPHGRNLFASPHHLGFAAASYLGMTAAQLQGQVQSGKTLAQIAEAIPGKSKAGLVDALVAAKKAKLAALVHDGKLSQAKEQRLLVNLEKRLTRVATRTSFSSTPG
jgi:hypothetical protein